MRSGRGGHRRAPGGQARPLRARGRGACAARRFGTERLGKGVVLCKDTPNFIANRLGVYGFMVALRRALDEGYRFDEVDTIMGEPMGRPRSAIFRTCDIAGLDVLLYVAQNVYDNAPNDECRDVFAPLPLLQEMVARGWLGEKSGQGFYKRIKGAEGSEILVLDPETMEYRPREKWRFDSIGEVKDDPDPAARIRGIVSADDRAAHLARPLMLDLLTYSARRVPEIADSPQEVDDAMRWGFNWALGPFQTWDALGVAAVATMLQSDGREMPPLVHAVLERGEGSFYTAHGGARAVLMPTTASYVPLPLRPSDLTAEAVRRRGPAVLSNRSASLLDMGDGVALLEYHSKLNTIDQEIVTLTRDALERGARDFRALVIGNDAADFSVGANVAMLLMGARMRQWSQLERVVKAFQDVNMATKYSPVPVVVAAAGGVQGGACRGPGGGARGGGRPRRYAAPSRPSPTPPSPRARPRRVGLA